VLDTRRTKLPKPFRQFHDGFVPMRPALNMAMCRLFDQHESGPGLLFDGFGETQ
jgi:hypothetical protein